MKKLLLITALLFTALSTSACAQFGAFKNPVDRDRLVAAESAYGVVLTSAVAYRKLCAERVIARATCAPVVARLQAADRKVQVALKNLRGFTRDHPTIDAISLIIAVKDAVDDFKASANADGVK